MLKILLFNSLRIRHKNPWNRLNKLISKIPIICPKMHIQNMTVWISRQTMNLTIILSLTQQLSEILNSVKDY
jgi:hypothetical protein